MTPVEPVDALLAIDIGNTCIGLAICDHDGIHDARHINGQDGGAWRDALAGTWRAMAGAKRRGVVIGSVCPERTRQMMALVEEVCRVRAIRVRDDIPLPMPLDVENEVGVDRVCAAAAAHDRIRGACAVAAFGTAITVDCVAPDGRFLGGAILPGLEMACNALHDHTAQLPRVTPAAPNGPFGRCTHDAIINGVAYGAVGALREIVERYATELHEWPQLVITGGNAPLVRALANFVDAVVPDLCLMGIALAYQRAAGQS